MQQQVIIVGGGMVGLSLALMLAKSNIAVKLLEAVKYPNYDDENLGAKGPMLGLMSAMYQYPNTACMLVSVDMFLLQAITIKYLFEQYITQRKLCTAYKTNKIQPLCAIYTYEVLPYIEHRVANAKDESDYSVNALIMTLAERETERGGVCFIEGDAMSDTDDHIIQSLTHINNKKELAEYYSDI